jgi:hypothetical protein
MDVTLPSGRVVEADLLSSWFCGMRGPIGTTDDESWERVGRSVPNWVPYMTEIAAQERRIKELRDDLADCLGRVAQLRAGVNGE